MAKYCRIPVRVNDKSLTSSVIADYIDGLKSVEEQTYFMRLFLPGHSEEMANGLKKNGKFSKKAISVISKNIEQYLAEYQYELNKHGYNTDALKTIANVIIERGELSNINKNTLAQIYDNRKLAKLFFAKQNYTSRANSKRQSELKRSAVLGDIKYSDFVDVLGAAFKRCVSSDKNSSIALFDNVEITPEDLLAGIGEETTYDQLSAGEKTKWNERARHANEVLNKLKSQDSLSLYFAASQNFFSQIANSWTFPKQSASREDLINALVSVGVSASDNIDIKELKRLVKYVNNGVSRASMTDSGKEKSIILSSETIDGESQNDNDWDNTSSEDGIEKTLSVECRELLKRIPKTDENGEYKRNSIGFIECYDRSMILDAIVETASKARSSEEMIALLEKGATKYGYLKDVVLALNGVDAISKTKLFCSISKASLRFMQEDSERGFQQRNKESGFSRSKRMAIAAINNGLKLSSQPPFYSAGREELLSALGGLADVIEIANALQSGDELAINSTRQKINTDNVFLIKNCVDFLRRCGIAVDFDTMAITNSRDALRVENLLSATGQYANELLSSLSANTDESIKEVLLKSVQDLKFDAVVKAASSRSYLTSKTFRIGNKTYHSQAESNPILDFCAELEGKSKEECKAIIDKRFGNDPSYKDADGKYYGLIGAIYNGYFNKNDLGVCQMMDYDGGKQLPDFSTTDLWTCWLKMFAQQDMFAIPLFADRQVSYYVKGRVTDVQSVKQEMGKFLRAELNNVINVVSRIPQLRSNPDLAIKNHDVKLDKDGRVKDWGSAKFSGFNFLNSAKIRFKNEGKGGYRAALKDEEDGVVIELSCPQAMEIGLLSEKEELGLVDFIREFYSSEPSGQMRLAVNEMLFSTGLTSMLAGRYVDDAIESNKAQIKSAVSEWVASHDVEDDSLMTSEELFLESFKKKFSEEELKKLGMLMDEDFVNAFVNTNFVKTFLANSLLSNASFVQLTFGNLSCFKDAIDFVKRNKINASSGLHLDTTAAINGEIIGSEKSNVVYIDDEFLPISDVDKNSIKTALKENGASQELLNSVDTSYNSVNTSDGQSWLTFAGYRKLQLMCGRWSQTKEKIYQLYKNGRYSEINLTEMQALFVPIKTITNSTENIEYSYTDALGRQQVTTKRVPVLHKDSEALNPLIFLQCMQHSENETLKKIRTIMDYCEKNNIDKIAMDGAIKSGRHHMIGQKQIALMESGELLPAEYVHQISNRDKYVQGSVTDHGSNDDNCVFSSQIMKILSNNVADDAVFKIDGKEYSGRDLKEEYNALIGKILCRNYIDAAERVSDPTKIVQLLEDMAKEEGTAVEPFIKEALSISSDGEFIVPPDLGAVSSKIVATLTSIMRKRTGRINMPGGMYVQRSNWGFSDDLHIIKNEDGQLEFECYLPAYSKQMYQDYILPDGTIDMDNVPEELRCAIGVRIPTVDRNYGVRLRVKGFSPRARGSEIILPTIFTELTGSDFDIDKLYVTRPYLSRSVNTEELEQEWQNSNESNESFAAFYERMTGEKLWKQIAEDGKSIASMSNRLFKLNCALLGGGNSMKMQMHKADMTRLKEASVRGEIFQKNDADTLVDAVNSLIEQGKFSPKEEEYKGGYPKTAAGYMAVIKVVSGTEVTNNGATANGAMKGGWRGNFSSVRYLRDDERLSLDLLNEINDKAASFSPYDPGFYSEMLEPLMGGKALTAQFAVMNGALAYCQAKNLYVAEKRLNVVLNGNAELDLTSENKIAVDRDAKRLGSMYVSPFAKEQGWTSKTHMIASYCDVAVDNAKEMALGGLHATRVTSQLIGFMSSLGYTPQTITTLLGMPGVYEAMSSQSSLANATKAMTKLRNNLLSLFADGVLKPYNRGFVAGGAGKQYAPYISEGKNMETGNVQNNKFIFGTSEMMLAATLNRRKYSLSIERIKEEFDQLDDATKSKYATYLKTVATALDNAIRLSTVSASFEKIIQKSKSNTGNGGIRGTAQNSLANKRKYDQANDEINSSLSAGSGNKQTSPIVISNQENYKFQNFIYTVRPLEDPGVGISEEVNRIIADNPTNKQRQIDLMYSMIEQKAKDGATFYDFFEGISIRSGLNDVLRNTITGSENYNKMVSKLADAITYKGYFGTEMAEIVDKDFISYMLTAAISSFDGFSLLSGLDMKSLIKSGTIKAPQMSYNDARQQLVVYPKQTIKLENRSIDLPEISYIGNEEDSYEKYSGEILKALYERAPMDAHEQAQERANFAQKTILSLIKCKEKLSEKGASSLFFDNLVLIADKGQTTIKLPESIVMDDALLDIARQDFRKLLNEEKVAGIDFGSEGRELAENLVRYSILQNGCNFGGDSITCLMHPVDLSLAMNGMIRNVLSVFGNPIETNGAGPKQSVCDDFIIQFVFNHLGDIKLPFTNSKMGVKEKGKKITFIPSASFLSSGIRQKDGIVHQKPRTLILHKNALYRISRADADKLFFITTNEKKEEMIAPVDLSSGSSVTYELVAHTLDIANSMVGFKNGYFFGLNTERYIKSQSKPKNYVENAMSSSVQPNSINASSDGIAVSESQTVSNDTAETTDALVQENEENANTTEESPQDVGQYVIDFDRIETGKDIDIDDSDDDEVFDDNNDLIC